MNEDNNLCEGNLDICIDCTADVRVCQNCGAHVVFESSNQPPGDCPMTGGGQRLQEFEICNHCFGTFCIDCMDDAGEICKTCSSSQWDDLTIFTGENDEEGLAALFGDGNMPSLLRRNFDIRINAMPRNDLMRLWDTLANVHPRLRDVLGFPAPAIEGITDNDFRVRILNAADDMTHGELDGAFRYITEVMDVEAMGSAEREMPSIVRRAMRRAQEARQSEQEHDDIEPPPDYMDTDQSFTFGARGAGRSGFMENLRRVFNSNPEEMRVSYPNPPIELAEPSGSMRPSTSHDVINRLREDRNRPHSQRARDGETIVWGPSEGQTQDELRNFINRLHEMESDDRREKIQDLSHELGNVAEWDRWVNDIPFIQFPRRWYVKIIPPTMGAVVRFIVGRGHHTVSVYLDCYHVLGSNREPYWEINPGSGEDGVERFDLHDIRGLLRGIEKSLRKMNREGRSQ